MERPKTDAACYLIRCYETGRDGNLKLVSFFNLMQECAAIHAEKLGFGFADLSKLQLCWVLSRLKLEIFRPQVKSGEFLTVKTWPSRLERLFAHREFVLTDEAGKCVGRASSAWLLLNRERFRPVSPAERLPEPMPDNSDLPLFFPLEEKIDERELPELFKHPIQPTQEDVNGHLNNAEYAGLVQDAAFLLNDGELPLFRTVELNFNSAMRAPETMTVHAEQTGKQLAVTGKNENGKDSFRALAELV